MGRGRHKRNMRGARYGCRGGHRRGGLRSRQVKSDHRLYAGGTGQSRSGNLIVCDSDYVAGADGSAWVARQLAALAEREEALLEDVLLRHAPLQLRRQSQLRGLVDKSEHNLGPLRHKWVKSLRGRRGAG